MLVPKFVSKSNSQNIYQPALPMECPVRMDTGRPGGVSWRPLTASVNPLVAGRLGGPG